MTNVFNYNPRNPREFPHWDFDYLDIEYDAETLAVWMNYKTTAPHCYTLAMLAESADFRESLRALFNSRLAEHWPIRYFVMASNKPAIFSLGGDLPTFVASIRNRDRKALFAYAHACIDVMHGLTASFDLPIVTLSAVRGQCLGGGFEGALSTDFFIAERGAKLAVPEVSFNTFPGMGAMTFLKRRIGAALSERIVSSGAVYSASEMHDFGVVDILAPVNALRETTDAWMREGGDDRWRRRRALADARRRCFPITHEELTRIVELWADCAFSISDKNLHHMERLMAAQNRLSGSVENTLATPGLYQVRRDATILDAKE